MQNVTNQSDQQNPRDIQRFEREREKSKGSSKFEREKTCLKKFDVLLLIWFDCEVYSFVGYFGWFRCFIIDLVGFWFTGFGDIWDEIFCI